MLVDPQVALQLLLVERLEVEQRVVRALGGADQLVELDLPAIWMPAKGGEA
jgi:hypothetical protein